jgi:tetratricopeptide (TPR) repeat protein
LSPWVRRELLASAVARGWEGEEEVWLEEYVRLTRTLGLMVPDLRALLHRARAEQMRATLATAITNLALDRGTADLQDEAIKVWEARVGQAEAAGTGPLDLAVFEASANLAAITAAKATKLRGRDYGRAKALYSRAVTLYEEIVDTLEAMEDLPTHPDHRLAHLWATWRLVELHQEFGRYADARFHALEYLAALDTMKESAAIPQPRFEPRFNAAEVLGNGGEPEQALQELERLHKDEVKALGPDHPSTLTARHQVAHYLGACGRGEEALRVFEQVYADRVRVLGADHPSTLITKRRIESFSRTAATEEGTAASTTSPNDESFAQDKWAKVE